MTYNFYLNGDKSLTGMVNEHGEIQLFSNHPNKSNGQRLIRNIENIINLRSREHYNFIFLNDTPYVAINTKSGNTLNINELTSFETKIFAREDQPEIVPFERFDERDKPQQLKTDVHTHFAAALSPEQLIECSKSKDIIYPEFLVKKLNLNLENCEYHSDKRGYLLKDLLKNNGNRKIIIDSMKIDTSEQETFNRMEEIYTARGPFTKNSEMFIPMLDMIANDAMINNVKYMEFSVSSIFSDMSQLALVEKYLPEIENKYGVKIRFLGALYRHSDKEWNEDEVEKLKISAKSPYIVGCDFMGHETNPTKDIYEYIKELAKYSILNDPNFAIRVHAGENIIFKSNVRQALLAVEEAHRELTEELKRDLPYPQVRIGHGIYGFDEQPDWDEPEWSSKISTMELCNKIKPVIEFNLSSNLSLNNINDLDVIPIKKYIDSGIKVVLGTDGKGIYSTTISQEMILAKQAGLTNDDFEIISSIENEIIKKESERFERLSANKKGKSISLSDELSKLVPHYTKEVEEKYRRELQDCQKRLKSMISECGAETDPKKIAEATDGKRPILLTGSSHKHFPKIEAHPEQLKNIKVALDVLIHSIDPEKSYLMTGGTNHGIEKILHELVNKYNKTHSPQIVLLGTLTEEAAKNSNSPIESERMSNRIEKDTINYAITPILNGKIAKRWFDLPDTVLDIVQESKGTMIAIGGGAIVGDMIVRAHNMGLSMNIMSGVEGASNDKSKSLHGNGYSFSDAYELIEKLLKEHKSMLRENISPETVKKLIDDAIARENTASQLGN